MKASIEIDEQNYASVVFETDYNKTDWDKLSRDQQILFLGAISQFHELFSKHLKIEKSCNTCKHSYNKFVDPCYTCRQSDDYPYHEIELAHLKVE